MFRVYVSDNFPMVKKVTTVQNQADPALEGKYTLTIQENQVTVEQNEFNGTAKCDPADSFDLGEGVKIAMGRLLEAKDKAKKEAKAKAIKVGDLVKVVNSGKAYTTYCDWLLNNKVKLEYLCRYRYNTNPYNGLIGKVLYVAPWKPETKIDTVTLVLIQDLTVSKNCYLISVNGIEKVKE